MRLLLDSAWVDGAQRGGTRLTVEGGRIAALESIARPDNGWHALPGFVNAHVHLDLSSIRGEELPRSNFAAWVEALVARRTSLAPDAIDAAVRAGIAELLASGTVAVGDIDSFGRSLPLLRESALDGVAYRELLGRPEPSSLRSLEAELERGAKIPRERVRLGVAPHAPYSTSEELYRRAFAWNERWHVPLASHVAETSEEEELLMRRGGPLAALFERWKIAVPAWIEETLRPAARLFALEPPRGFVVVHGNRLTDDEIVACARHFWPIVYCPRSHRYFARPRHPVARVVGAGGVLALGTDSRASNASLDLWSEMAALRSDEPLLSDGAILVAATSGGRRALELEPAELAVGHVATFQLARARDEASPRDVEAAAVRGELKTALLFIRGDVVFGDAALAPFDSAR